MSVIVGLDIGTTKIAAVAYDMAGNTVIASRDRASHSETHARAVGALGYSEWSADAIVKSACLPLRELTAQLSSSQSIEGVVVTGQQHGSLLVDNNGRAVSPLITWMDRRADARIDGRDVSTVELAANLLDPDASSRTGCRLASGYMGTTLFWLQKNRLLPARAKACFITDYFNSFLCGQATPTDPSMAASSGLFDIGESCWDRPSIEALGLSAALFPDVCPTGQALGSVSTEAARATGLPAGLPVFLGLGDNQASFLATVGANPRRMLVNVGTGAQVTVLTNEFILSPPLETRPFLDIGYLLVSAQLSGGHAYAMVERFFRDVGSRVFGITIEQDLFQVMNRLARSVPPGSNGLKCCPRFCGSRTAPDGKAEWSGMAPENFNAANMVRAVLEGMVEMIGQSSDLIRSVTGISYDRLIGSGNGLRQNALLCDMLSSALQTPLYVPPYHEEAAVGAAIGAAMALDGGREIRVDGPMANTASPRRRFLGMPCTADSSLGD